MCWPLRCVLLDLSSVIHQREWYQLVLFAGEVARLLVTISRCICKKSFMKNAFIKLHGEWLMAERWGFEPQKPLSRFTRFPVVLLRPTRTSLQYFLLYTYKEKKSSAFLKKLHLIQKNSYYISLFVMIISECRTVIISYMPMPNRFTVEKQLLKPAL